MPPMLDSGRLYGDWSLAMALSMRMRVLHELAKAMSARVTATAIQSQRSLASNENRHARVARH